MKFTIKQIDNSRLGEVQWYSPLSDYSAKRTPVPLMFEARCYVDALDQTWPWRETAQDPQGWAIEWHHPLNGDKVRVYRYGAEELCYAVRKEE